MAITQNDITSAYRFFLGREPAESEVAVWSHEPSIASLRGKFIASEEFQQIVEANEAATREKSRRLPLDLEPITTGA